jgi:hypothetical protein
MEKSALASNYAFITLGDWGGASLGGQDLKNVQSVSVRMAAIAEQANAQFIMNTGDNFYWCGIQNTSDFQIQTDFEKPFLSQSSLQIPWYSILGNHEYGYNVSAQIDYARMSDYWVMDDRYYTRRIEAVSGQFISFIFIDTSPCVSQYRSSSPSGWDPCGTTYPTCSLHSTDDDFEGECQFHQNIIEQDCSVQYEWFVTALAAVPHDDWLIVSGHHPIDEVDEADFTSALQNRGFSLYLNGHSHALTQYTIDNQGAYVTSGAGSLVNTPDQSRGVTLLKVDGQDISLPAEVGGEVTGASTSHSYQTVYNKKVAGFTLHTFASDFSYLVTDFVDYTGAVIHSFKVYKNGTVF